MSSLLERLWRQNRKSDHWARVAGNDGCGSRIAVGAHRYCSTGDRARRHMSHLFAAGSIDLHGKQNDASALRADPLDLALAAPSAYRDGEPSR